MVHIKEIKLIKDVLENKEDHITQQDEQNKADVPKPNLLEKKFSRRRTINKFRIQINDHKSAYTTNRNFKMLSWLVLASAVAVFNYMYLSIRCMNSFDRGSLLNKLKKLHGQDDTVEAIVNAFSDDEDTYKSKILFFYGGTGVGKTFTTDLIFGDSWNNTNIYHFTMPSFREKFRSSNHGMAVCTNSVVVVDDLAYNDNVVSEVTELLNAANRINNNLTLILIYNCENVQQGFVKKCEDNFSEKLKLQFDNLYVHSYYIHFNSLTEQVLRKCIESEIQTLSLKDVDINALMKNFDVTADGCKGVQSKIRLLYH